MARWSGARWRPVTRYLAGNSHAYPIQGPRRLIYHTAVSGAESLHGWMNRLGNPVSHFYVGASTAEQYIDTDLISTANLQGNHDCITVETRDIGGPFPSWSGSNVPAWTDWQVRKLADLAAWCHDTHGIPLTLLPDSKPGRRGVGYHRLGIDPWRVSGGEKWSSSPGKVCPGDRRIAQIPTIINLALDEGDDMPTAKEIVDELMSRQIPKVDPSSGSQPSMSFQSYIRYLHKYAVDMPGNVARAVQSRSVQVGLDTEPLGLAVGRTRAQVRRIEAGQTDPAELATAIVAALPPGSPNDVATVEAAVRNVLREGVDT